MSSELEQFNAHQEDVRRRVDSLARSIFILSGGALTLSIGLFTGGKIQLEDQALLECLSLSWWALFLSITLLTVDLVAIIIRDYDFGERWRRQLDGGPGVVHRKWLEWLIVSLAGLGIVAFLTGMLGLAWVATSYVGGAN